MALIDYKNVSIFHQDDAPVLSGIDFSVSEGEFIYIIGKVGSGKSSLLRTFYAELDVETADQAEVLGRDMMAIKRKEIPALRRELGIIFQDFKLLTKLSVYKNLEFVLKATGWEKDDIPARINEVLEAVGMAKSAEKMPYQLSGGEQQRIAIARSLLNNPKIILADEPTGNLDPETADNIVALLKDITASGTAVVMTTHNLPMLDKFPGVVYQCQDTDLKDITAQYRQYPEEEEILEEREAKTEEKVATAEVAEKAVEETEAKDENETVGAAESEEMTVESAEATTEAAAEDKAEPAEDTEAEEIIEI